MSSLIFDPQDILDATTDDVLKQALIYARISVKPCLSPEDEVMLQAILEEATGNGALSFWISEFDHIIGHELGLLTEEKRDLYKNQQAILQEYCIRLANFTTFSRRSYT